MCGHGTDHFERGHDKLKCGSEKNIGECLAAEMIKKYERLINSRLEGVKFSVSMGKILL